ncbi:MAG: hypothetical protein A3D37_02060 [Candidatus Zambryskibacteria bacterium RIFCSPHIGHO2_02_FULL_38_22]|nr:MAG: hypothetical protein A3D37_02060 [Candidatus Zambryskibacteria bacterium RIFCSPHIGHO2_02_FULL_38_22]
MADPRKDFVVRLAPGIRLGGQGNENVTLEEEGAVVKIKGIVMQHFGCFTFYAPTCLNLPEYLISSVTENGVAIFPR